MNNQTLKIFFLIFIGLFFCSSSHATLQECISQLTDFPQSSKAQVCLANELEISEKELHHLESEIENELANGNEIGFSKKDFQKAQSDWKKYRESSCWLDAAQAANTAAIQLVCETKLTQYRVTQFRNMLSCIHGDECDIWGMSHPFTNKK